MSGDGSLVDLDQQIISTVVDPNGGGGELKRINNKSYNNWNIFILIFFLTNIFQLF